MNSRLIFILCVWLCASQYLAAGEANKPAQPKEQNGASSHDSFKEVEPVSYASIRRNVQIKTDSVRHRSMRGVRPANSYQLAGAANKELCDEVLAAFNEQGTYQGPDEMFWVLDNSKMIEWQSIEIKHSDLGEGYQQRSFGIGLEYAAVDIDGDGDSEYVYRLGRVLSSHYFQSISIYDVKLQDSIEKLAPYTAVCEDVNPKVGCEKTVSKIVFAMSRGTPRLKDEWGSTSIDMLGSATDDIRSRKLIFTLDGRRFVRNVPFVTNAYWNIYRVKKGAVAVVVSDADFAPPEFLIFAPSKEHSGDLQCVIMPMAWNNSKVVN